MTDRNEKLAKDILDELKKTGYPTEVVSSSIIQQHGWGITHNPSYLDDVEGVNREYDIRAYKSWPFTKLEKTNRTLDVFLLIDCKKSEKPWVFFTTNESHIGKRLGSFLHTTADWLFTNVSKSNPRLSDDVLHQYHHYFQKPRLARTFHEPFKKQEKSDNASPMIYSAVMSVIKATLFHVQGEWGRDATIFYPIIIFNGNLFEAIVSSVDKIELIQSDHIQLSFNYMLPISPRNNTLWKSQKTFIVDVVQENYLPQFLKIMDKEHSILSKYLKRSFSSKKDQGSA